MRVGVFGAGAWGTALAIAFSKNHDVTLWGRNTRQVEDMARTRRNPHYLPDIAFPDTLRLSADFNHVAAEADLHLVVTPLAGLRGTVNALRNASQATPLLWACKGFEQGTGKLPHEIVAEELGTEAPCGVLTGPSFAAEVAAEQPTAITLVSADAQFADHWARLLHQPRLRIYANTDVIGAELGGAIKNIMAIAAGICDGMGFGLNARAALMTRGLAEITRLATALGGRPDTLMGLAGMGDLILTCTGDLSRNRRVGLALAKGQSLADILRTLGHVAEGVPAAREAVRLAARHQVDMPICSAVDALLHGDQAINAETVVERLLSRDPKHESA